MRGVAVYHDCFGALLGVLTSLVRFAGIRRKKRSLSKVNRWLEGLVVRVEMSILAGVGLELQHQAA
jgi:hypothetical protein